MQVQQEAVAKEYANMRYQQPYQLAMFEASVALEAQRWHVREYAAVIEDLTAADLEVGLALFL
jgi:insulysin